jgi:hypothetical protein
MVRFADSTTGWIVGWGNIYKTTDGGNSWITQDSSGGTALEILNDKIVFYSNYRLGIRKTTDSVLMTAEELGILYGQIQQVMRFRD